MIWRCRFDSSTTSKSMMPSVPTPAAARYISAGEPRPPAPTHQHLGVLQPLLPGHADVRDDQVARVAADLVDGELAGGLDERGQRHGTWPPGRRVGTTPAVNRLPARMPIPRLSACGHGIAPGGRHHVVRRAGPLGRLGRPRGRAAVPVRRAGRGRRRPRAVRAAAHGRLRDDAVLDRLDAVVFAGGADLDPALYGEQPHPETTGPAARAGRRRGAADAGGPRTGTCRCSASAAGCSCCRSCCGGTLVQHLPEVVGHERHRPSPGRLRAARGAARAGVARAHSCSATRSACRRTTTRDWRRRAR